MKIGPENPNEEKTEFKEVEHNTVNFIDDSNSNIPFSDPTEATFYIERFFKILRIYYNNSKLKINADKTSFLVLWNPKHKEIKEEIII